MLFEVLPTSFSLCPCVGGANVLLLSHLTIKEIFVLRDKNYADYRVNKR
jgi:hypothetical protein